MFQESNNKCFKQAYIKGKQANILSYVQNRKLRGASRAVNFTDTAGKYEQGT